MSLRFTSTDSEYQALRLLPTKWFCSKFLSAGGDHLRRLLCVCVRLHVRRFIGQGPLSRSQSKSAQCHWPEAEPRQAGEVVMDTSRRFGKESTASDPPRLHDSRLFRSQRTRFRRGQSRMGHRDASAARSRYSEEIAGESCTGRLLSGRRRDLHDVDQESRVSRSTLDPVDWWQSAELDCPSALLNSNTSSVKGCDHCNFMIMKGSPTRFKRASCGSCNCGWHPDVSLRFWIPNS